MFDTSTGEQSELLSKSAMIGTRDECVRVRQRHEGRSNASLRSLPKQAPGRSSGRQVRPASSGYNLTEQMGNFARQRGVSAQCSVLLVTYWSLAFVVNVQAFDPVIPSEVEGSAFQTRTKADSSSFLLGMT